MIYLILFAIAFFSPLQDNVLTYRANLSRITDLDDKEIHVTLFLQEPSEDLILPKGIDIDAALFGSVFYTNDSNEDAGISIMRINKTDGDELYIDLNNDEDLTNDGGPIFFDINENSTSFDIACESSPRQKTKVILRRKPELAEFVPDSMMLRFIDSDGNLQERFARLYGMSKGAFDYEGKKGTFYFDSIGHVRRGTIALRDNEYQIGIFDFNNNGLFDEDKDFLLVDLNMDGELIYSGDQSEVFKLNEVFQINGTNYKVASLSKYGEIVELQETNKKPSFDFRNEAARRREKIARKELKQINVTADTNKTEFLKTLWELQFETLDGDLMKLKDFEGKFILLNFWGEWCKPCIEEIPELVKISEHFSPGKIQIVGFLNSSNLDLSRTIIQKYNMSWPQTLATKETIEQLQIHSWPTNILLFPGGKDCIKMSFINTKILQDYIK